MRNAQSRLTLAAHVLRTLAIAHAEGSAVSLDELVEALGVRRADVRQTISQLHAEELLDALRMRLTMRGLTLGTAFAGQRLAPLRAPSEAAAHAA